MTLRYSLSAFLALALLAFAGPATAQSLSDIVINEVDADQTSTDSAEFLELYNTGTSAVDLSDAVLVFFNGSDDASYAAFDLDGITLAAGDYFVLCANAATTPNCDLDVEPDENLIQNGADAVALMMGDAASFPTDTPATTVGLIDVIVYGTDDSPDGGLLAALGETIQYDEDATGNKDTESNQRTPDGGATIFTALPTPGEMNAVQTGPETFTALVRGANEVPAVETGARGGATVTLEGTTLTVTGAFAYLESDYLFAHLHGGAAGENGPVRYTLTATVDGDARGGVFTAADNTFPDVRSTFADSLRAGLIYINVHSADNSGGEIRGQFGTGADDLPFALSGDNEVPPVATGASGFGNVNVDGTSITLTGSFMDLEGNYRFSHIHAGATGSNGPVVVTLMATVDSDQRGGTYEAGMNTFEVSPTFADSLRAGLAYVNVHSDAAPSGELRGQISFEGDGPPVVSVADARAAGVGATVRIEAVVSRAMGAFAYVQDATGGLTIRQTSGAFRDAVENGDIAGGTILGLTGTLSEFNNLLQINNADLDAYEILGSTDVPEAQTVTLSELATNGEDYEAELILVESVSFSATGTFEASTNYDITDPTDMSNTVALRVVGADDTMIDGTDIPTMPVDIAGVLGQFQTTYQLLPINAGDVGAGGISTETDPEGALSLAVVNPASGDVAIRYSLRSASPVTLTVFDALGREVAALVDAEVASGAHVATWAAGSLAPGVYVLRLQADDAQITRTITVVR